MTSHFDESIMIGTREMSGSAGDQLEEAIHRRLRIEHRLVHVDVDHLRAVLDLLAGDGQRVVEAAFEDHAREGLRAGDVGALADVDEQRVLADVEGLEAGQAQLLLDLRNGARLDAGDASAIAAMWSGEVPQQPPTMLTKPFFAQSAISRRPAVPAFRRSRRRRWAGRRSGAPRRSSRRCATVPRRTGAAPAPSAQLRPKDSGPAWFSEFQKASAVCPTACARRRR
jgi:hypothetical protein